MPLVLGWLLGRDQRSGLVSTVSVCFLLLLLALLSTVLSLAFSGQFRARTLNFSWPRRLGLKITPRRIQFLGIGLVGLAMYLNGLNPYKLRFQGLSGYPPEGRPVFLSEVENTERQRLGQVIPEIRDPRHGSGLIDDRVMLGRWSSLHESSPALTASIVNDPDGQRLPRLAIVACSGGGLRAAIWTAFVLRSIEATIPEFPQHTRMIFWRFRRHAGASYYVSSLAPSSEAGGLPRSLSSLEPFIERLDTNFLAQAIRALAFNDFLTLISPFTQTTDRGQELEAAWVDRLPALQGVTFEDLLRRGEARAGAAIAGLLADDRRGLQAVADQQYRPGPAHAQSRSFRPSDPARILRLKLLGVSLLLAIGGRAVLAWTPRLRADFWSARPRG